MIKGRVTVLGMEEVQAKLDQVSGDLSGAEMIAGMKDAALIVTRDAKVNAPVDTGRLRASIVPEVRVAGFGGAPVVQGVVGSNVAYAPFQERGTHPFWPLLSALETWAKRHGTSAYLVARAISVRGIKAVRYLQRALEDNADRIYQKVGAVVSRIVER